MNREQWNAYVRAHDGSFLQSWEWGEFQKQLGHHIQRLTGEGFVALLIRQRLLLGLRYWYTPYGPVLEHENALPAFFDTLADLRAEDRRLVFLKMEPQFIAHEKMVGKNHRPAPERQPTMTIVSDLTQSEDTLFDMLQKKVRYAIRKAEEYGVEIVRGTEMGAGAFDVFWELFSYANQRHGLRTHAKEYFSHLLEVRSDMQPELFFARVGKEYIAVALMLFWHDTATYLYAGSRDGYGRYNAPSFLIWNAMKDTKRRGMKQFDFWGISDRNPKWSGVTAFKRGFAGREIQYAGTWDIILRPLPYTVYRVARKWVS